MIEETNCKVVAPATSDIIRELREHHAKLDPDDHFGLNSAEFWEYRLQAFGYLRLFSDWYIVGRNGGACPWTTDG